MLEGQASKVHPPAPLSWYTVPTFKSQSWHLDQEDWNIDHNIDNNINNDKLEKKRKATTATTGTQIVAGIGGFQTICLPQVSQRIVVHPGQKLAHAFASTSLELISFPEEPPCSAIEIRAACHRCQQQPLLTSLFAFPRCCGQASSSPPLHQSPCSSQGSRPESTISLPTVSRRTEACKRSRARASPGFFPLFGAELPVPFGGQAVFSTGNRAGVPACREAQCSSKKPGFRLKSTSVLALSTARQVNSSELLKMSEASFDEPLVAARAILPAKDHLGQVHHQLALTPASLGHSAATWLPPVQVVPCRWCLVVFLPPVQVVPCGTQLHLQLATDLQLVPSQVMPLAHGGPLRCARQLPLRPLGEGLPSFMPSQFGAQRLAASQSAGQRCILLSLKCEAASFLTATTIISREDLPTEELDCPLMGISGLAAAAVDSDAEPCLKLGVVSSRRDLEESSKAAMQQRCCQARRLAEQAAAHNGRPRLLLLVGASRQFLAQSFLSIPVMQHVRPAFFACTSSQPWSKNRRPRSCVCRQVACLATTTTAGGQSAETLLGAMSVLKLPLLAADVAGHDVAPLGYSLSCRQGQGVGRLATKGSFLANLVVEVTLQQATCASGATYASGATLLLQCRRPAEPRVMAILGGMLQQQQHEQPQLVVFALGSAPFVLDPSFCLRALPPRPAEISLGARLLLPLRTSSFQLCKQAAPWQQQPLMPTTTPQTTTGLFAGLCLLGSATRLLDSSCVQQAPCERSLWAQMSKDRVVGKTPGAHLGLRVLVWPARSTCWTRQHVGAEEEPKADKAPGYCQKQTRCNVALLDRAAPVRRGCPCAMDVALLDGSPSERPRQAFAKVAGSGSKSCATSSCTAQVKQTQDLLQAALRTYIPAFMCRKQAQPPRRSLLQAARLTSRCTADGPAPGKVSQNNKNNIAVQCFVVVGLLLFAMLFGYLCFVGKKV
ncbi:unnamed protein product [Polarella glacialis]|uniref:Transmembrane protein n=1 Tax=Polarella glacialis TaxID=89957 RepID=A0A813FWN7_POLGL|nr:unnamed protein product [Polarella glacialis]